MINYEKAQQLRALIEKAIKTLTDEEALTGIELFPRWGVGISYQIDDRFSYQNKLYKVIQVHISQDDWKPDSAPALYTEVVLPGTIPVWNQPLGTQDAYQKDDKVYYPTENDSIYISIIDNNVWAPDVYGWELSV